MGILDSITLVISRIVIIFAIVSFFVAIIDLFVEGDVSLLFLNIIGLVLGFILQFARVFNFFPYLQGDFSEILRFLENTILFFLIVGSLFFNFLAELMVRILFLPLDLFFRAITEFHNNLDEPIIGVNEILNGFHIKTGAIIIEGVTLFGGGDFQVTPSAGQLLNDLRNIAVTLLNIFFDRADDFFLNFFGIEADTAGIDYMIRILAVDRDLSPTLEALGTALGSSAAANIALQRKTPEELEAEFGGLEGEGLFGLEELVLALEETQDDTTPEQTQNGE